MLSFPFSVLPCKLPRPSQTLSFYRFKKINDLQTIQEKLFTGWGSLNCTGRVYVSNEGINAQMAVPLINWKSFVKFTDQLEELHDISKDFNMSLYSSESAFERLHIRLRSEIVAAGFPLDESVSPSTSRYVNAEEWNKLLESPSLKLVDVRNVYESEIGYFEGAIKPDNITFRESLAMIRDMFKGKEKEQLLMYCTGGIRCVKAAAYLEQYGFDNIVQLKGGIVNYSKQVKELGIDSKFKGKNFVFDGRLAEPVGEQVVSKCHQCGSPSDSHQRCKSDRCYHLFIQCETCRQKYKGTCSEECKKIVELPKEEYNKILKLPKEKNYVKRVKPRLLYNVQ